MNLIAEQLAARLNGAPLRIGTRTTPLALAQTERVVKALKAIHPGLETKTVGIKTSADLWTGELAKLGGKGNFTKEIDQRLLAGSIDIAVHSMKDVPGDVPLPAGTEFGAFLERGDVHDVVIAREGVTLADLPVGAKIGTSAVRRRAQLHLWRPDLEIEYIRGGIDARVKQLDAGEYEAIVLARTGLERIGLDHRIAEVLPTAETAEHLPVIAPAVGAAVIAVQARSADAAVMRALAEINHELTATCVTAERMLLHMLQGHCNSPIAGHCHHTLDGKLSMFGMVFNRDGSRWVRAQAWGPADDPNSLGAVVAADLLRQGARRLIASTKK